MTEIKPGDKLRIIDDVTGHGFKDGAIVTVVGGDIDEDSPLATTLAWEDGDDIPAWDHGVTAYVIIGEEAEVIRPDRPLTLPEPQPMLPEWAVRKVLLSLDLKEPHVEVVITAARGYALAGDE